MFALGSELSNRVNQARHTIRLFEAGAHRGEYFPERYDEDTLSTVQSSRQPVVHAGIDGREIRTAGVEVR